VENGGSALGGEAGGINRAGRGSIGGR
jgi:hypothetical protein